MTKAKKKPTRSEKIRRWQAELAMLDAAQEVLRSEPGATCLEDIPDWEQKLAARLDAWEQKLAARLDAAEQVTGRVALVEAARSAFEELLPGGHDPTLDGGEGRSTGAWIPDDPLVQVLCNEEELDKCSNRFHHGHAVFADWRGESPEIEFLSPTFRDDREARATVAVVAQLTRENGGGHIDLDEARRRIALELKRKAAERSLADSWRQRKRAGEQEQDGKKEREVSR